MGIVINLDVMMARRKKGLKELSAEVDITMANLSILKNNKQRQSGFPPWRRSVKLWTASREIY